VTVITTNLTTQSDIISSLEECVKAIGSVKLFLINVIMYD